MSVATPRVIVMVHDYFEDLEFWYPVLRLREAGISVSITGETAGARHNGKYGVPVTTDSAFDTIDPDSYQGLIVPGGWAPDKLRRLPAALAIVKAMCAAHKPVAHICHGGWVFISADCVRNRRMTSTPAIKDDIVNAGGIWEDAAVVVDNTMVSSRRPQDLPEFMKAFLSLLARV